MAVRKKNRRRIVCNGRSYVWYILTGDRDYWQRVYSNDWETPFLHIASEDKRLVLTIPLNAPTPYAVSKEREFQGKPTSGRWECYPLPFKLPESVTPKLVSEIIEWAVGNESEDTVKVEYGEEFRF